MQRFLRDPRGNMSEASLSGTYGELIELIRKHFAPGVAATYAVPRLGADGVLEWWTSQQGAVTQYAALSEDAQQALLRAYDAHVATLGGLAEAMRARGMEHQAQQIEALRVPPDLDKLYGVDGRLLIRLQDAAAALPAAGGAPAPSFALWRWLAVGGALLLALLLAGAWWWYRQPASPSGPALPAPSPEPKAEPVRTPEWPTELVFVLETAARMKAAPEKIGGPERRVIGHDEIRRIVDRLPDVTDTRLVTFPAMQCGMPHSQGAFPSANRAELLQALKSTQNEGKAALADGLKIAAATVDGVKRDALIFLFLAGADECGQDICATAVQLSRDKPRLRINIVDLSGTHAVAACLSDQSRVGSYAWTRSKPDGKGVDLSREASRMLSPATDSAGSSQGAASAK